MLCISSQTPRLPLALTTRGLLLLVSNARSKPTDIGLCNIASSVRAPGSKEDRIDALAVPVEWLL
jgi:hypothetical protein